MKNSSPKQRARRANWHRGYKKTCALTNPKTREVLTEASSAPKLCRHTLRREYDL